MVESCVAQRFVNVSYRTLESMQLSRASCLEWEVVGEGLCSCSSGGPLHIIVVLHDGRDTKRRGKRGAYMQNPELTLQSCRHAPGLSVAAASPA